MTDGETTSGSFGWGLIGASRIAAEYVAPDIAAHPDSRIAGVFSTSPERGEDFAAQVGAAAFHTSLDDLLADPAVDVVYISTTNDLHAEQTIAAARAGKHVLCEKPLALTVEEAQRMVAACEEAGVVLATNHHLRSAPTLRAVRRAIREGAIGTPLFARVSFAIELPEPAKRWRLAGPGAGPAYDLTVHSVDTIRFLFDADVEEVSALTVTHGLAPDGVEDGLMATLRLDNGVLVSLNDAFTVPHAETGVEIRGDQGSIEARNVLTQRPVGTVELIREDGRTTLDPGERTSLYRPAVDRMYAAARGEGEPVASGRDGLRSLDVALAVLESARSRRVVEVGRGS